MEWCATLTLMVLMHVVEDFHLQGRMADMKQKAFWEPYGEKYAWDHVPALLLHGFEWSVLVAMPIMLAEGFGLPAWFYGAVALNGLVHSYVDHLKCNRLRISLVQDQCIHMMQVVALLAVCEVVV